MSSQLQSKALLHEFWAWFSENEHHLFQRDVSNHDLVTQMTTKLDAIHHGIDFMFGDENEFGKRRFIITGYANKEMVPVINQFTDTAPPLSRFEVIKLVPRSQPLAVKYGHVTIEPRDIHFGFYYTNGELQIELLFQNAYDFGMPAHQFGAFTLVMTILGEEDMIHYVQNVMARNVSSEEFEQYMPILKLREQFDALIKGRLR